MSIIPTRKSLLYKAFIASQLDVVSFENIEGKIVECENRVTEHNEISLIELVDCVTDVIENEREKKLYFLPFSIDVSFREGISMLRDMLPLSERESQLAKNLLMRKGELLSKRSGYSTVVDELQFLFYQI